MFYYVAYDLDGIKLFETDEDGIIHEFKDENHFYDPEDKLIYPSIAEEKFLLQIINGNLKKPKKHY